MTSILQTRVRVCSYSDRPQGGQVVDTTTRATGWSRGLSPMVLGPVRAPDGAVSQTVENAWQYSKVYQEDWDVRHHRPKPSWYRWRASGFAAERAERYPKGKAARPVGSWLPGDLGGLYGTDRLLDYIEARKLIYLPAYVMAVKDTEAFRTLSEVYLLTAPEPVWLRDFDGYDHIASGMSLDDVLHCSDRKMGHAFVLARMLEGL